MILIRQKRTIKSIKTAPNRSAAKSGEPHKDRGNGGIQGNKPKRTPQQSFAGWNAHLFRVEIEEKSPAFEFEGT